MTTSGKTPSPKPLQPLSQQQVTDALHTILRSHMQTTHARPRLSGASASTQTQRNAALAQALQRAQRNL